MKGQETYFGGSEPDGHHSIEITSALLKDKPHKCRIKIVIRRKTYGPNIGKA